MRNSNGPDTIMIGISPPFLPDESPAELLSSTHEYNTNITYPLFLTSEADTFTFPPEGLQIPYVSRETDPIIDKDVGWNDSPDSPYPIPSKSPDEPTHDIPIVNPIDGVQEIFFRQLIDEYKDIFVNDIPVEGSSLPHYELSNGQISNSLSNVPHVDLPKPSKSSSSKKSPNFSVSV